MFKTYSKHIKHRKTQSDYGPTDKPSDIVNYSGMHATKTGDLRTDGKAGQTDEPSYRDALTHLIIYRRTSF